MLIQFTVENFLSIRDKVYFSFEPSKDSEHPENLIKKGNYSAVSLAAVYGANASGKTSLFRAITVALNMIGRSNQVQITDRLPVVPFEFDISSKNKASSFEFTFIGSDEKKYIYGFSATATEVVEEYLYIYNSAKATVLFDVKAGEEPKFNRNYKAKLEAAYQMNTPNKLFLATATTWNVECTKIPYEWFIQGINTLTEVMSVQNISLERYNSDEQEKYIAFTKNLLKEADINISSIQIETEQFIEPFPFPAQVNSEGVFLSGGKRKRYDIKVTTGHIVKDNHGKAREYSLDLLEESLGTQLLFFYGPLLKDALDKGKTLVLDEIDKSMHPSLVKLIINLFRNPDVNKKGAQLIFTTHETGILSLDLFRRDQIYFTEKDSNTGVTDLYSLDEFSVRKTENIEKGYLMGRYGAIPFLRNEEVL